MSETFTKLPALDSRPNPCLCCPPIPALFPANGLIAVGFGGAWLERNGEVVLDGEQAFRDDGDIPTGADAEKLAAADPNHDWRICLHGPLHGETYQRQGEGQWVLVESNEGFV